MTHDHNAHVIAFECNVDARLMRYIMRTLRRERNAR